MRAIDYKRDLITIILDLNSREEAIIIRTKWESRLERPQHSWWEWRWDFHKEDMQRLLRNLRLLSHRSGFYTCPLLRSSIAGYSQSPTFFMLPATMEGWLVLMDLWYAKACAKNLAICWVEWFIDTSCASKKGSYIKVRMEFLMVSVPMLGKFWYWLLAMFDQGGRKAEKKFRNWLRPWHADIKDFLELKRNMVKKEMRGSRILFYALWNPWSIHWKARWRPKFRVSLFLPKWSPRDYLMWHGESLKDFYENTNAKEKRVKL